MQVLPTAAPRGKQCPSAAAPLAGKSDDVLCISLVDKSADLPASGAAALYAFMVSNVINK